MIKDKTILIFGGSGTFGTAMTKRLLEEATKHNFSYYNSAIRR